MVGVEAQTTSVKLVVSPRLVFARNTTFPLMDNVVQMGKLALEVASGVSQNLQHEKPVLIISRLLLEE